MPKNIVVIDIQRPHTGIPWGFVVSGGKDQVKYTSNDYRLIKVYLHILGTNIENWKCEEDDSCIQSRIV